jgi:hypothetical protein
MVYLWFAELINLFQKVMKKLMMTSLLHFFQHLITVTDVLIKQH